MSGGDFRLEVKPAETGTVIALRGALDLATVPALEERLRDLAWTRDDLIVVDLRGLRFMDAAGLSALVRAHAFAHELGRGFALVRNGPDVDRLMSITGVDRWMTMVDEPEEVL